MINISRYGCVIHMDPKKLDHKALWGNRNQIHSRLGGKRYTLTAVGSRHQIGVMCLVLQGTPRALLKRRQHLRLRGPS